MLTSRERVIKAISHKEPDMVPIDFGGMDGSGGIHALALKKLLEYLRIKQGLEVRIYDVMQMLGEIPKILLERFEVDIVSVRRTIDPTGISANDIKFKDYILSGEKMKIPEIVDITRKENGTEYMYAWFTKNPQKRRTVIAIRKPSAFYFDQLPIYTPLREVEKASDIKELPPHPAIPEYDRRYLEILRKNAKWLFENTSYAIFGMSGVSIFETTVYLLGFEKFAINLRRNKSVIERIIELLLEHDKIELKKYLDAVGDYLQIIGIGGEDLGTQTAPLINPKDWRELFKPAIEEIVRIIKSRTNCYVLIHSCGSIKPFIPDFIDIKIDVLNPVQISAKDMNPQELKREFGDEISFWGGGCDTQRVLPRATPNEVKRHVKNLVEIFKPGGGFVFNQVHNIQPEVPPENIVAMFEAVKEVRKY